MFEKVRVSNFVSQNPHLKTTQCWRQCGRVLRLLSNVAVDSNGKVFKLIL